MERAAAALDGKDEPDPVASYGLVVYWFERESQCRFAPQ